MTETGYLLDTHAIYWWMTGDKRLSKAARKLIAEEACAVSVVSIWEMVLKSAKGKLPLPPESISENLEVQGFRVMPIYARHVEATRKLPATHDDPFDRLLLATGLIEHLVLLTGDAAMLALLQRNPALPLKSI